MAKTLTAYLLKESFYQISPPNGKLFYRTDEDYETRSEELLRAEEIDPKIPYPLLNPLQTLFYKLYKCGNALIASPTSSGKSLIAYLFMKNSKGRLVYTAPTKPLVMEKVVELKRYYGKNVEMRTGDTVLESYKEVKAKVLVNTYEHLALSFRNSARWLEEVNAVVVDEVHMISKRWMLEEIITACKRKNLSLLCLSATIPSWEELARWIEARLVIISEWRPVPLNRNIHKLTDFEPIRKGITGKDLTIAGRLLNALFHLGKRDEQVILFVPKKEYGWKLLELAKEEKIGIMNQTLPFDVEEEREPEIAFHNADVPKEEREEIERAFREGRLRLLVATQTLAYGVNLPADRVIILTRFFKKEGKIKSIPDTLDILQMEGRAGRLGIKEEGYSDLLVYGARELKLEEELKTALQKPFTTALLEGGEKSLLSLLLLLAHLYEGENFEEYLRQTYSFKKLEKHKLEQSLSFLRNKGYLEGYKPSEKGMLCIRLGIPPVSFEEFLRRRALVLDPVSTIRPLLHMKKFDSLFSFLKERENFEEDYERVLGMLLPCGEECEHDNTHQLLFYTEGFTVRYPNLKNPPGEFSYLGTDALHLLKNLIEINKKGFYTLSTQEMLKVAHALKYGINPEYSSIAGIKGLGHIRANLIKNVLKELGIKPPKICTPVRDFFESIDSKEFWELLLEKYRECRSLDERKAESELEKLKTIFKNNLRGHMIDDKILLAYSLFVYGTDALKRKKRELIQEVCQSF